MHESVPDQRNSLQQSLLEAAADRSPSFCGVYFLAAPRRADIARGLSLGAEPVSGGACRAAATMLALASISFRLRSLYSALRLTMVPTARAISSSDRPRTHPAVTSSA